MTMDEIIGAENLTKSYGSNTAVDHLSLHIKKGEFFGFWGRMGRARRRRFG